MAGAAGAVLAAGLGYLGSLEAATRSAQSQNQVADKAATAATQNVLRQLEGETEKSRAEFLRGQREKLYTAVVEHDQAMDAVERDLFLAVQINPDRPEPDIKRSREAFQRMSRVRDQLTVRDKARMTIIGSTNTEKVFVKLVNVHDEIIDATAFFGSIWTPDGGEKSDEASLKVIALVDQLPALRESFYKACRVDMGAR